MGCSWHAVASWKWDVNDDACGICHMPFDGCCPDCKMPGDDCAIGTVGGVGLDEWWLVNRGPESMLDLCGGAILGGR